MEFEVFKNIVYSPGAATLNTGSVSLVITSVLPALSFNVHSYESPVALFSVIVIAAGKQVACGVYLNDAANGGSNISIRNDLSLKHESPAASADLLVTT